VFIMECDFAYRKYDGHIPVWKILSRVLVTEMGFGLVIGFINRLQLQTITCNTSCYTIYNNLLLTIINTAMPLFQHFIFHGFITQ
jgi:hypothetical protein